MKLFPIAFNTKGSSLGFYYNVSGYILMVPLVVLVLFSIGYNVLIGFASKWMYKNAFKRKLDVSQQQKPSSYEAHQQGSPPPTTIWEDLYVGNMKVVRYLLGDTIVLNEGTNGYLELHIHEYEVHMPLAMIFLQLSQFLALSVTMSLFVEYLVVQVTSTCKPHIDCFLATESDWNAQPLDCALLDHNTSLTCFHLSLEPAIAVAVAGGTIKVIPTLFSMITFQFIKYVCRVRKILKFKNNLVVHIIVAAIVEGLFIGFGLIGLIGVINASYVQQTAEHLFMRSTSIFVFAAYFLISFFLWCIYPCHENPVRFVSAIWKQRSSAAIGVPQESKSQAPAHELQPLTKQ